MQESLKTWYKFLYGNLTGLRLFGYEQVAKADCEYSLDKESYVFSVGST